MNYKIEMHKRKCNAPFKQVKKAKKNNRFLPNEIMIEIFGYFGMKDTIIAGSVCKGWYEISRSPYLLKGKLLNLSHFKYEQKQTILLFLENMFHCRYITNLSVNGSIDEEIIMKIFSFCPEIKNLEIKGPERLKDNYLRSISLASQGKLESLSIDALFIFGYFVYEDWLGIFQRFKNIKHFRINTLKSAITSQFGEENLHRVIVQECQNLISLELPYLHHKKKSNFFHTSPLKNLHLIIGERSYKEIPDYIENFPKLENLVLDLVDNCYIPDIQCSDSLKMIKVNCTILKWGHINQLHMMDRSKIKIYYNCFLTMGIRGNNNCEIFALDHIIKKI